MGRIESYFLRYNDDVDREDRAQLIADLHKKILHGDDVWHFFYEGRFDELRFHSKFKKRVDKFLSKDWRVESYTPKEDGWVDDQRTVEEYKDYFTVIFHQNSEIALALDMERADDLHLQLIIDRVVHSFFDMLYLRSGKPTLELDVMKDYLVDRAFYFGMTYQSAKQEKTNE